MTEIDTALAPGQFWTEYDFQRDAIVLDERLSLDVPPDRPLTVKTHPGVDPSIRKEGGRRYIDWNGSNLKPEDENAKSVKSSAPNVAAIRLTTFQSWEQVGRWYAALSLPQLKPTDEIRKKAAELTAGRSSDVGEGRGALRLRRNELPLRQPVARGGPISASGSGRRSARAVWRLQGQAHAPGEFPRGIRAEGVSSLDQLRFETGPCVSLTFAVRSRHHLRRRRRRRGLGGHDHRGRALPTSGITSAKQAVAGGRRRRIASSSIDAAKPTDEEPHDVRPGWHSGGGRQTEFSCAYGVSGRCRAADAHRLSTHAGRSMESVGRGFRESRRGVGRRVELEGVRSRITQDPFKVEFDFSANRFADWSSSESSFPSRSRVLQLLAGRRRRGGRRRANDLGQLRPSCHTSFGCNWRQASSAVRRFRLLCHATTPNTGPCTF